MATSVSSPVYRGEPIYPSSPAASSPQSQKLLEQLEQLQGDCGLQNPKYGQMFQEEELKCFSKTRAQCLRMITEDSGHFLEVKEKALDLFILILNHDPYGTEITSNRLVDNLKDLMQNIQNIENQVPSLQSKFMLAYITTLDHVICHYYGKSLKATPEQLNQDLKQPPKLAVKFNKHDKEHLDPSFEYLAEYALQAPQYLKTEKTKEIKFLERFINFAQTCHAAYKFDLGGTWTDLIGGVGLEIAEVFDQGQEPGTHRVFPAKSG